MAVGTIDNILQEFAACKGMVERALFIAGHCGLKIIPVYEPRNGVCACYKGAECGSPGKHPRIGQWPEKGTRNPDRIRQWWGMWPNANIGIPTGAVNNLVVVDCDSPEAIQWAERYLDRTPMQTKTGKGLHLWYRWPGRRVPNDARIETNVGKLALDIRGDGGQVLAPGSLHYSGARYQMIGDWSVDGRDTIPTFNDILMVLPEKSKREEREPQTPAARAASYDSGGVGRLTAYERARRWLLKRAPAIEGSGGDNHTYNTACCVAVGFDLSDADALTLLREWNETCQPPWNIADLERKIRNAREYCDEQPGFLLNKEPPAVYSARIADEPPTFGDDPSFDSLPTDAPAGQRHGQTGETPSSAKRRPLPSWRTVTDADVEAVIAGTALEPLVRLFRAPMNPPLPLAIALPKALALAGCALSGPVPNPEGNLAHITKRGIDLARVRIQTAGGQACNQFMLIAAGTGMGKDVGGRADDLAMRNDWVIGVGGSAEGIADVLCIDYGMKKGSGIIRIDEFSSWLDKRGWQAKAAAFLTSSFNRGWFCIPLSKHTKNNGLERDARYCYPSILANVQPETLARLASAADMETGFLARFAISRAPDNYHGRPVCADLSELTEAAQVSLERYKSKAGIVRVNEGYLSELWNEFIGRNAPHQGHWKRLVNEYGPRWAVMLSVNDSDHSPEVTLTPEAWNGAAVLIRWFYGMAEPLLSGIAEDEATGKYNRLLRRTYDLIGAGYQTHKRLGPMLVRYGDARMRRDAIAELVSWGVIEERDGKFKVLSPWPEG